MFSNMADNLLAGHIMKIDRVNLMQMRSGVSEHIPCIRHFRINRNSGKVQWRMASREGRYGLWQTNPVPRSAWDDLNSFIEWCVDLENNPNIQLVEVGVWSEN